MTPRCQYESYTQSFQLSLLAAVKESTTRRRRASEMIDEYGCVHKNSLTGRDFVKSQSSPLPP